MFADSTFAGRVAVVTGGGSGIGLGLARRLAELGAVVVLVGRDQQRLSAAANEIGGDALAIALDVRDRAAVELAERRLADEFGGVDLLVNAAAGNFRVLPEEMSPGAWSAVVQTVLDGTWNWCQVVGRRAIVDCRPASIVNIGSIGALIGGPDTVHSASAKGGVVAMTKSLAGAWGQHGIRVNSLTPGVIADTPGARALLSSAEAFDAVVATVPMRRPGTLNEIVSAGVFLLSDEAGYVTGANLVVDGGRSLGRSFA